MTTARESFGQLTTRLADILAYQETLLDPEFDTVSDDLEREFQELRMTFGQA